MGKVGIAGLFPFRLGQGGLLRRDKKSLQRETRAGYGITCYVCSLGADSRNRAGVHACTAVDAGVSSDGALVASLADCVYRARIVACATVDALFRNGMSQSIHLLLGTIGVLFWGEIIIPGKKSPP
jgi:ribosomal protein L37AE/L43A